VASIPDLKRSAIPDGHESWRIFRIMAEFVEGFEVMAPIQKGVSIFGSARTKPDDKYYQEAEKTAQLLAKAGFTVITGGGPGIMEAANKGAFDAGKPSIGLNISLPHEQESNRYQTISIDFHYFYARKVMFVKYATAFVCFPGGYGTLDEFFETLTLIQTMKIKPFPIVLYGKKHWTGLAEWMKEQLIPNYVDPEDPGIFRIVDSVEECVDAVKEGTKKPWWKPIDKELRKISKAGNGKLPISSRAALASTGEGTRYGSRPKRTGKAHVKSHKKPEQ
jgi:uncharacterized protein (TIGR00730 family)